MRNDRTVAAVPDDDKLETAIDRSAELLKEVHARVTAQLAPREGRNAAEHVAREVLLLVRDRMGEDPGSLSGPAEVDEFVALATRCALVEYQRTPSRRRVGEFGVATGGGVWVAAGVPARAVDSVCIRRSGSAHGYGEDSLANPMAFLKVRRQYDSLPSNVQNRDDRRLRGVRLFVIPVRWY